MNISYQTGNAALPHKNSNVIIIHIVNNVGVYGGGFFGSLLHNHSNLWDRIVRTYLRDSPPVLGEVRGCWIDKKNNILLAHLCAQNSTISASNPVPLQYAALRKCLIHVRRFIGFSDEDYEVQAPRIGAGLAGGDWDTIEEIIHQELCDHGIQVTIFDLPS
jgi:hypothetical protein